MAASISGTGGKTHPASKKKKETSREPKCDASIHPATSAYIPVARRGGRHFLPRFQQIRRRHDETLQVCLELDVLNKKVRGVDEW